MSLSVIIQELGHQWKSLRLQTAVPLQTGTHFFMSAILEATTQPCSGGFTGWTHQGIHPWPRAFAIDGVWWKVWDTDDTVQDSDMDWSGRDR